MENAQREIEAKFALPNRDTFERLATAPTLGALTAGVADIHKITDRYLDTKDRLILSAGYACRVRETGKMRMLALKSLGVTTETVKERKEYQVAVNPGPPVAHYQMTTHWPAGSIRSLVEEAAGDKELATLLVLRQMRHVRTLSDGQRPVAELSLDVIRGIEPDPCYDLEIELLPGGTPTELSELVTAVEQQWGLTPTVLSKFERELGRVEGWDGPPVPHLTVHERAAIARSAELAPPLPAHVAYLLLLWDAGLAPRTIAAILGLTKQRVLYWLRVFESRRTTLFARRPAASRPKAPEIGPDDPMSEVGRATLRLHFWRMLDHEPGTRLGSDIEELHDMRVATRRMRAALELFEPYFQARAVAIYSRLLRRTGRALGPVRDLDVFEEKARIYLAAAPPEQQSGLDTLLATWHDQRIAAREAMLAFLDGNEYARFVARFGRFLTTAGREAALPPDEMPRVCDIIPQLILSRFRAVQSDGNDAQEEGTIEQLHALRIDCKALRYALEFFSPVLGWQAGSVIDEVKVLQDHLGDLNDAHIAAELLRSFLPSMLTDEEGILAYLDDREAECERLRRTFPGAWAGFSRPELEQSLVAAVSVL
jgi:CHAD domain-containing protein